MDALIVTPAQKAAKAVESVVRACGDYTVTFSPSAADALGKIRSKVYDLVIIDGAPACGRSKEAALTAASRTESGVILLVGADMFEKSVMQLSERGIVAVSEPLSKIALLSAVRTVYAFNMRLARLRDENRNLNKKLEDLKIVDRAKIALVVRLGYTESEAHKYIERQAMNLRTSRRDVAVGILKTYEY